MSRENPYIFDITFFSDEAWFYMPGYVNSQNVGVSAPANLNDTHKESFQPQKIGM
jgi:hypothetical protein